MDSFFEVINVLKTENDNLKKIIKDNEEKFFIGKLNDIGTIQMIKFQLEQLNPNSDLKVCINRIIDILNRREYNDLEVVGQYFNDENHWRIKNII